MGINKFLFTIFSRPKQKLKRSWCPPRWKNLGYDLFILPQFPENQSKTEWISLVEPERFRKSRFTFWATFEVDHFSQLGRSDWKLSIPCDRLILNPSTSRYTFYVQAEISVTRTSMCFYNRLAAASQTKCMFWLLETVYSWENFKCSFRHSKVVFELNRQISGISLLKTSCHTG